MASTNLPAKQINDSAARSKLFFDSYGKIPLQFNATDVDATVAFFKAREFGDEACVTLASAILKQAKLENLNVFEILDKLKVLNQTDLSALVSEILNNNRTPTSTLGYRQSVGEISKTRNVVP
jgi:hypothetical protein